MNAARRPERAARAAKPKADPAAAKARAPRQSIRQVASTWLAGIRFSGFSIIMMGVLVLAVVVLAPSIAEYAKQRQQIAELKAEVARQEAAVAELAQERERWNDETFIVTQARERLYYVRPGEVSYLVIDDRTVPSSSTADASVSAEVTELRGDWMQTMLTSMMTAGLAPEAGADPAATTAPAPTPTPADEGNR
ncbi:septum formation initiator family protein [Agromyces aurantiacus]|uniref:Septum formation initiator family protein n=1 Tax=Agromyces aurantiacus TaxID=165814 RepID=A0ABV9R962_9MICO|nr:septum formation initiator family protein [Agromyces aurantiacus]MBM7505409.1 cell division protein FtsB [Agromyces aurantiacus]